MKECKYCGKEFEPTAHSRVYCTECKLLSVDVLKGKKFDCRKTQICEHCGSEYIRELKTKYCSVECRRMAERNKQLNLYGRKTYTTACNQCGKEHQSLEQSTYNYCSRKCYNKYNTENNIIKSRKPNPICEVCGKTLEDGTNGNTRYCTKCKTELRNNQKNQRKLDKLNKRKSKPKAERLVKPKEERECVECGNTFNSNHGSLYCSTECGNKHNNRVKELNRRTQLKINGKIQYDITLDKLIARDNNVCHICGKECDKTDRLLKGKGIFIARQQYPSIDHIKPISKGGTHTWDNVKLAHRGCNSVKSNKDVFLKSNGQVTMAI